MTRFAFFALAPICLGLSSSLASAQAEILLPGVVSFGGVSDDGTVVAGLRPTLWTQAGGETDLFYQGDLLQGRGVSPSGEYVVGSTLEFPFRACLYTEQGGVVPILNASGLVVQATGLIVNDDGTVYGSTVGKELFQWSAAGGYLALAVWPDLFRLEDGLGDGSFLVGSYSEPATPNEVSLLRWDPVLGIDTLLDGSKALVSVAQSSGAMVGSKDLGVVGGFQLFEAIQIDASGATQGLGFLPGDNSSTATGVDDSGGLIVGYSQQNQGQLRSFIWDPLSGMRPFTDFLAGFSDAPLAGWSGLYVDGLSGDGRVFWGGGISPDGIGEAFVLYLNGAPCVSVGTSICGPAVPNSSGQPASIQACGAASVARASLSLEAQDLPANQFGYFLNSQVQASVPMAGGSQGTLCLGGAIGRYSAQVQSSGILGTLSLDLDLSQTPTPGGPVSIAAGETWTFQAWFRDANPQATSNFTDAVEVTFQP